MNHFTSADAARPAALPKRVGGRSLALFLYFSFCAVIAAIGPWPLVASASTNLADEVTPAAAPTSLGLYFDADFTEHTISDPPLFQPFSMWLVAKDIPPVGLKGWETSISFPPQIAVLASTLVPPTSINVGQAPTNFIVGAGACLQPDANGNILVVQFTLLLTADPGPDAPFTLGPSNPSSFQPPVPGWLTCDGVLLPFDQTVNGIMNPTAPPVKDGIEIAVGDGTVGAGTVDVPVTVQRVEIPKVDGTPSLLAGLDLTITWDPTLASLSDVLLTPVTQGWLMEFNAGAGTVDISMASLDTIYVPPTPPLEVLQLRFDASGVEGQTPLTVTSAQAFDLNQDPIPLRTVDGSLTTGCEKGDVVPDGEINSADAIRTLLIAMDMLVPTPEEFCAADVNSDGVVDVGDAVLVLQLAVGFVPQPRTTGSDPFVYLRSGSSLGDVIVHVENLAGLELALGFDPQKVHYVSASAGNSKGLVAADEAQPGLLRVGFARASNYEGDIELHFDVLESHTTMSVVEASAFDEYGERHPVDLLTDEFAFGVTGTDGLTPASRTQLLASTPNPFNPRTELRFVLHRAGDAELRIFDSAGRQVRVFTLHGLSTGAHAVTWDGRDAGGTPVASGTYLIQLRANGQTDAGRVTLLK